MPMATWRQWPCLAAAACTLLLVVKNVEYSAFVASSQQKLINHNRTTTFALREQAAQLTAIRDGGNDEQVQPNQVTLLTQNLHPHHPVCRPSWRGKSLQSVRRVYYAHTRKAGGTYLRQLLRTYLTRPHKLTLHEVEGTPLLEEPGSRNDTLYVTILRHPVQRILSSYKFEGRGTYCGVNQTTRRYQLRLPPDGKGRTLERFVQRACTTPRCPTNLTTQAKALWICSHSCLLRWYGPNFDCLPFASNMTTATATTDATWLLRYQATLERLLRFDLIVDQGRLSRDPAYLRGLLQLFSGTSSFKPPPDPASVEPPCGAESHAWNKKVPPVLPNETVQQLHEMNRLDIRLYQDLTSCPEGGVVFPQNTTSFAKGQAARQ